MFKVELQSAVRFVLGTSGRRAWLVAAGLSWVWDSGWVGYGGMGAKTVGGYRLGHRRRPSQRVGGYRLALESHDRYTVLTRGSSGREPRSGQSDHDAPIDGGKMKKWTGKVENGMLVTWRRVGGPHGRPTHIHLPRTTWSGLSHRHLTPDATVSYVRYVRYDRYTGGGWGGIGWAAGGGPPRGWGGIG